MNIFRIIGDSLHIISFMILLGKILYTKDCYGTKFFMIFLKNTFINLFELKVARYKLHKCKYANFEKFTLEQNF